MLWRGEFFYPTLFSHAPQDKEWAAYAVKKVGGNSVKTPVESTCLGCYNFWQGNLSAMMSLEEFRAKMDGNPTASQELAVASDLEKGTSNPSFPCVDVVHEIRGDFEICEHGLWLTETQFVKLIGFTPQECGIKAVVGVNAKGQHVRGYAVENPDQPFPTWSLRSTSSLSKREYGLDHLRQRLPKQGAWVWDWFLGRRSKGEFGAKGALGTTAHSIDELKTRGAARKAEAAEVVGNHAVAVERPGGIADADEDDLADGDERIERAGQTCRAFVTPIKGGRSSEDLGRIDEKSQWGGTQDSGDGAAKRDGRRASAAYWIEALNLEQILAGQRLGRQRSFAENSLKLYSDRSIGLPHTPTLPINKTQNGFEIFILADAQVKRRVWYIYSLMSLLHFTDSWSLGMLSLSMLVST